MLIGTEIAFAEPSEFSFEQHKEQDLGVKRLNVSVGGVIRARFWLFLVPANTHLEHGTRI